MSNKSTQKIKASINSNRPPISSLIIEQNNRSESPLSNTSNSFKSLNQKQNKINEQKIINPKELIASPDDDKRTLLEKNKGLLNLVIQSSNKIAQLNGEIQKNQEIFSQEKEQMLFQIDKISSNYENYSKSHQRLLLIEKDFEKLVRENEIIRKSLNHAEELVEEMLFESIKNLKRIHFITNKFQEHSSKEFLLKYKNEIISSINKLTLKIEIPTCSELISEFGNFLKSIGVQNQKNNLKSLNLIKKAKPNSKEKNKNNHEIQKSPVKNLVRNWSDMNINVIKKDKNEKTRNYHGESKDFDKSTKNFEEKAKNETNENNSPKFEEIKNYQFNEKNDNIFQKFTNHTSSEKLTATATYDFIAKRDNELSFKKGDVLEIKVIKDHGWWIAILNGNEGLIPYNYVQIN